ncbi:serine/threonine-protein kinase [Actinoplanes missouriensis]|uniref:serine/threonine-protein kinase n=1 Tax=Actinoplanes missouriensis TaxID=1866 RepID=UPI0033CCFC0C
MAEERKLGGRYRLGDELGRGGMAVVWRALDEVLGRPVAIKVLAGRYAGEERFRARILHEARAAATLSHPNIAQIYDFGESAEAGDDGRPVPYVVMELVNGPTLQQRVARGPIPPRTVFRIAGEVAAALAVAHADGLVHRDIKLANIMVTPGGAKVVDFGIAAVAGPASPEDALLGTPAYLAPERLTGGAIEPASDVYALGVMLYRLLAGVAPWSVETTTQMISAHVYLEPLPLPSLPGVPESIAELVARCLAKNPADRPGAAEASEILGDAAEAVPQPGAAPVAVAARGLAGGTTLLREATVRVTPGPSPGGVDDRLDTGGSGAVGDGRNPVPDRWWKRRKVLAGGGIAAVLLAAPLLWPEGGGEPHAAPGVESTEEPTSSPRVSKSAPAARGVPRPAAPVVDPGRVPESTGSQAPVASGALSSASSSSAAASSGTTSAPAPSPSGTVPPATADPPPADGTRLESPGGTVLARCVADGAELIAWEPNPGFSVDSVNAGPALTTAVVFRGQLARYRMTVTCLGDRPSAVVLPL